MQNPLSLPLVLSSGAQSGIRLRPTSTAEGILTMQDFIQLLDKVSEYEEHVLIYVILRYC